MIKARSAALRSPVMKLMGYTAQASGRAETVRGPMRPYLVEAIRLWGVQAMAADGLITIPSSYGPEETMNRFEAEVRAKGMTVFAHVDHAAGAAAVGLSLRPTDLLIFGNAKGGTPLMQSAQTIGIDLPLKALVWQDASGGTWLSCDDPGWLVKRHQLGHEAEATVNAMAAALNAMARTATSSL
jgi:uncharacterized protein (DUF302 family)